MVALRLTQIAMAVGLLSLGLVAGCQSSKTTTSTRDLPVAEAVPAPAPAPAPAPEAAPSPVPPMSVDLPAATEAQPMDITLHPDKAVKTAKAAHTAKAAAPFTGKRDRTKWYLVVASAKDHAKYLDEYAAFLNKHGVSVTVEKRGDMYTVLSTDGFATGAGAEAKALKARVVGLGKEYPGGSKGLWSDAYFLPPHGHKAAATKPAAKK